MFSVIITNPPYNGNPNARRFNKGSKEKRSTPKSIWAKFIFQSFDKCKHLLFLGPDKWRGDLEFYITFNKQGKNNNRGNKGECWKLKEKLMGERGLSYIKYLGNTVWKDVKTSVDFFHWEADWDGFTEISCLDGEITKDLKAYWESGQWVLPSRDIWHTHKDLIDRLYNWGVDNKILLRKTFTGLDVKDKSKPLGNYRYAHGVGWDKDEWKWKKEAHIHQTTPKVLISQIRKPRALYCDDCGIGDQMHYCLVKDEAEGKKLVDLIRGEDMKEMYRLFGVETGDPAKPPFWMYKWLKI